MGRGSGTDLYRPVAAPAEAGLESLKEIEIAVADGVTLVAWHAPAKGNKPTVLYFHGNAAANRAPKIETMRENGFGVFYLNNRGYGGSGGRPTEENNVADAIAAYDHLTGLGVPAGRMVAYGESLGSGQAVRLAAERPVAAVILEAPLTSTLDVARTTYFWLPLGLLITDQYNIELNIRSVTAPVLVLHGEQDAVIPVEMGWRVYRAANEPKRIELFPQGAHSDLFDHGAGRRRGPFWLRRADSPCRKISWLLPREIRAYRTLSGRGESDQGCCGCVLAPLGSAA